MNKLLKTLIFIAYTFVIFLAAMLIVQLTSKTRQFSEYTTNPYNDDITLNVQVQENRKSAKLQGEDYEYSSYDVKLFVTRKENNLIRNMYTHVCAESENGHKYIETSSAKKMDSGVWSNSTMYLYNSNYEFAYNKVVVEEHDHAEGEKVDHSHETYENYIPEKFYVKVSYEIEVEKEDGSEVYEARTLNYMFDYEDGSRNDYKDYEKRNVLESNIDSVNDVFKVKLTHTTEEKTYSDKTKYKNDVFKITNISTVANYLPENVSIERFNLIIEGEVKNEKMLSSKYFSNYVKLYNYNGALGTRAVAATREVKIEADYKIEKLYFTANILLTNGETLTTKYYVNVSDLLEK